VIYSFDVDLDEVCGLAIHCERHINLSAPCKTSGNGQVRLIKSDQALRPSEERRRVGASDARDDPRRVASGADARAE